MGIILGSSQVCWKLKATLKTKAYLETNKQKQQLKAGHKTVQLRLKKSIYNTNGYSLWMVELWVVFILYFILAIFKKEYIYIYYLGM